MRLGLGLWLGMPDPVGAGGSVPDWVPTAPSGDLAVVFADFANGRYWADGAVQTLDGLFYQDVNWDTWDPASLVPGSGLPFQASAVNPAVLPDIVTKLVATMPVTVVMKATTPDAATAKPRLRVDLYDPDFSGTAEQQALWNSASNNWNTIVLPPTSTEVDGPSAAYFPTLGTAVNFYLDHTVASFNGEAVVTATGAVDWTSPITGLVAGARGTTPNSSFFTQFIVFPPQADSDLPTLSTPV